MRKFFDINIPFNRLQFNSCFFGLLLFVLLLFLVLSKIDSTGESIKAWYVFNYILGFSPILVFVALYKRLKDLNKKNTFIFNCLFGCSLFTLGLLLHIIISSNISNIRLSRVIFIIFNVISLLIALYLLILAIFVKGNNDNYDCYKPKFKNIFNFKFFKNWLDFKGKATRSEFFLCGILILLWIVRYLFLFFNCDGVILLIVVLFPILTLSCGIRRLRDMGLSPWHYLILYVVPVNVLLLIVLMFGESEKPTENEKASQ